MDYCANCGCDISELGSNRCIGFACANRLCFKCFSDTGGYCPTCKVQREIDGVIGGASHDDIDRLYDEMGEAEARQEQLEEEVRKRREKEEEERIKQEEEEAAKKQKKDMWWFDFIDQEEEEDEEEDEE
jgi:hypothetical protein